VTFSACIHPYFPNFFQLRRQARERRQYVYARSLEAQERQTYDRKQQLKDALATGKALPTELRKEAKRLGNDLVFDEAQTGLFFFFSHHLWSVIPLKRTLQTQAPMSIANTQGLE
jgi:hypothetical protein